MKIIRTYTDLIKFDTFLERFNYLKLNSTVGKETFGFDRYINQIFYNSGEWRSIRDYCIIRDEGCDLAIKEREIVNEYIYMHHMNPISLDDIVNKNLKELLDPEFLITTTANTHRCIHYSDENSLVQDPIIRTKNDTILWR